MRPLPELVIDDLTVPTQQPAVVDRAPDGSPLTYIEGVAWSSDGSRLVAAVRDESSEYLAVIDRRGR